MTLTFTNEETELLIELFNARIEYIRSLPRGKRIIRGYENVRDLLSIEGSWDYPKPQRLKMLSCLNEATRMNLNNNKKDILHEIQNKLHLSPKDYF